jgi:hypothetical protein
LVFAPSPFHGTWRANNASLEYRGSNNTRYKTEFGDATHAFQELQADGQEYRINSSLYYGAPYADLESVREVNDHSIEITDKVSGKLQRPMNLQRPTMAKP